VVHHYLYYNTSQKSAFYNYKPFFCFILVYTWTVLNTVVLIPLLGLLESFVEFFRSKQPMPQVLGSRGNLKLLTYASVHYSFVC
jgi:hypothetical protein